MRSRKWLPSSNKNRTKWRGFTPRRFFAVILRYRACHSEEARRADVGIPTGHDVSGNSRDDVSCGGYGRVLLRAHLCVILRERLRDREDLRDCSFAASRLAGAFPKLARRFSRLLRSLRMTFLFLMPQLALWRGARSTHPRVIASSRTAYRSRRRKRQRSFTSSLLLPKTKPLRWVSFWPT